jgi:hypothetical protein
MAHRIRPSAAAAAVAALLIMLTACSSPATSVSSSGSCVAAIRFRGHTYGGSSLRTHPPYTRSARIAVVHMHVMGTGVIPACRDTNHSTDQDRPVPVARIDGVDPGLAVATYPAAPPRYSASRPSTTKRRAEVTYGAAAGFRA